MVLYDALAVDKGFLYVRQLMVQTSASWAKIELCYDIIKYIKWWIAKEE